MTEIHFFCQNCQDIVYSPRQVLASGGCCLRCGALLCSLDESSQFNAYRHLSLTKISKKPTINKGIHTSTNTPTHALTVLQIIPVKGDIREVEAISQLLNSLGRVAAPISFEIAGTDQRRYLLVRCKAEHAEMVKGRLTVIYGNPEVVELSPLEDPLAVFAQSDHVSTTRLHLRKPAGLPLRTYRELGANDTIMPILSALYDLSAGEVGCVQVVIHGEAPEEWAAPYKQELLAIKRRQQGLLPMGQLSRLFALIFSTGLVALSLIFLFLKSWLAGLILLLAGVGSGIFGLRFKKTSDMAWSEAQEEMVSRKIQMPAYQVEIRIHAGSADRVRSRRILESITGAFKVFSLESGNFLEATPTEFAQRSLPASITYKDPDAVNLLGDAEIATLWHLPVEELPDMLASHRVRHVLPDSLSVSSPENGWFIGQSKKSAGKPVDIWLPRSTITRTHALLIGRTRMGKSNTLEHMVREAARDPGRTVVVIDPHDDMVENLLGLIQIGRAHV